MKSKAIKMTALVVGAAMVFGTAATAVQATRADTKEQLEAPKAAVTAEKNTGKVAKDETVYVLSGADGSVKKIIVNDWLKNPEKADSLLDHSNLANIENVKGDESFTTGKDGSLTWNAAGQDIYYQGTTEEKTPVEVSIRYTLDGKEIKPEDLAGKSGKVTIRFDYKNNSSKMVKVNGQEQKIYVPFTMMTGVLLDTEIFENVTVTNGKMENLGNEIAVVGVAFPGMQENLNIDKEKLEIPDYVEITADVKNFEMSTTMTLATTALLGGIESDKLDFDELSSSMNKLADGMNQLMDGSDKLYNGLCTLLEQSQTLVSGIDQLASGATRLQAGADALNGGASQLQAGAAQLSGGLEKLNANSDTLNGGAQQVFNTLLATANTQLAAAGLQVPTLTIGNYADVLNGVINSLDEKAVYQAALQKVTEGVNARRGEIEEKVTEVVKQQVTAEVTAQVTAGVRVKVEEEVRKNETQIRAAVVKKATGLTLEQYEAAVKAGKVTQEQQDAVNAAVEAAIVKTVETQMQSEKVQGQIKTLTQQKTAEQMETEKIKAAIAENTEIQVQKAISDTMASPEVQAQLQAAAEGAKAVIALKSSLDSYNGFYLGLKAYTGGVASATAGAKELIGGANALKGGMSELTTGVNSLNTGIQTMKGKSPALIDGITQLRDGSKSLSDGLTKMMQEGIQKLLDLADKDLEDLTGRISACADAAKEYNSFTGIGADMEGTVKFIYKTDAVEISK